MYSMDYSFRETSNLQFENTVHDANKQKGVQVSLDLEYNNPISPVVIDNILFIVIFPIT